MGKESFKYEQPFTLENGAVLPEIDIAYHTYGRLNADKSNVIWVCHALTANSDVLDWWAGLFGDNDLFNPEDHFIICANNLGSCYGTTGPLSINSETGKPWYSTFPTITIRDMANALELLKKELNIEKIHTVIGSSQGGQIAQEWAIMFPGITNNLILIATNCVHSSWGIAFNESQRMAIKADPSYGENTEDGGAAGLQVARSIALLSYRNYKTYDVSQRERRKKTGYKAAADYQQYQGEKLVKRFNAYSYVRLSEAMDSHDVCRNRCKNHEAGLHKIKANTLVIGVTSDILFPIAEQKRIAESIQHAHFGTIDSLYGHDGFLIEFGQLSELIQEFYSKTPANKKLFSLIKA